MTLEEKAALCSGKDFWHTKSIERLGLPSVMVSDGPHGLRVQRENEKNNVESIKAVCFPSGTALASSFDRKLLETVGEALSEESKAEGVHTLLGPAINIKRSPLCGRNFEYMSEDPYVAGELAASYINAVQKNGVGTSLKHLAANNQEYHRMSISANVDERTLREIYLANFEIAVKKSNPWTIMCSYNRINGTYSCENEWLLNDVLRKEWGFNGIVMTDWGAMNNRPKALIAGLNLEMPSSNGENDKLIVEAVKNGTLDEAILNNCVKQLIEWIKKPLENLEENLKNIEDGYNKEQHHLTAQHVAEQCAVLLKNDSILPLEKNAKIALIGGFAKCPRYQGGGSSYVNSFKVTSALDAVYGMENIVYCEGFGVEGDIENTKLFNEAVEAAKKAEVAVIFAGLPNSFESEGYDRTHMNLPDCQNKLIEAVVEVQPNTVVVLHIGSPIVMPWGGKVKAILNLYLGGQAVGQAAINILFGDVNPSGKLAETFPAKLEDTPCYLNFPGTAENVDYTEGIYVGYRYYDARKMPVLYPFGFGLSYTEFEITDLILSASKIKDTDTITATVKIKNIGSRAGSEVVQLYVAPQKQLKQPRPIKELKGFDKVHLLPGEQKEVVFKLDKRSFAYYEKQLNDWYVESGNFEILVGNSSRNLHVAASVEVLSTQKIPFKFSDTTTCEDIWNLSNIGYLSIDTTPLDKLAQRISLTDGDESAIGPSAKEMIKHMIGSMPLHSLVSFAKPPITLKEINDAIEQLKSQI